MTGRRVVITGMGAITPLGAGVQNNWEAMLRGESGVRPIKRFDTSTLPVKFAGEIEPPPLVPEDATVEGLGIHSRFALVAGREAWASAGFTDAPPNGDRTGVFIGSGKGYLSPSLYAAASQAATEGKGFNYARFTEVAAETISHPVSEQRYHQPATHLARAVEARGPNWVCISACAAGNHAIGEAYRTIERDAADVILAGGTHSQIEPMSLSGYATLGALSTRNDAPKKASRPFDRGRDGFVLGEGAGILVLEEYEHAKRRGAHIRAEIVGYANTTDCYRVTDPHPDGLGAERSMRLALQSAGLQPADIGYVCAHGTSTHQNDAMESAAIKRVFGPIGEAPPVSSIKSMLGHLIAAAGAVEAISCVRMLEEGVILPTINYEVPDPACDLDYVPNKPRERDVTFAMNNSFGFGGQNLITILRRFED